MTAPIALSAISFHKALFSGQMRQSDVPSRAAALAIPAVELLDLLAVPLPFGRWTGLVRRSWHMVKSVLPFAPANPRPIKPKMYDPTVGEALRRAADSAGVRVLSWTLDTDLAVTGEGLAAAEAYWQRGSATAQSLGASVLRITSGGSPDATLLPAMRQNLQRLVSHANGLQVAVENHGGMSSDPALLAALVDGIAGVCLDLGNYPAPIRADAVRRLAPHTVHVHAKSYAFDTQGNETTVDYPTFIKTLREAGYSGGYSIEYEGYDAPEAGIRQTRALLQRLLS